MAGWEASAVNLGEYLKEGDFVDAGLQSYFLEVLFPAHFDSGITQIGEPHDHNGPDGRPRYSTIQRSGYLWVYTGLRCVREHVTIV